MFLGRIVKPGEPLWSDPDTGAVLAYYREKALECPGCGLPRDETMKPEAEGRYRSRPWRCHACTARVRAQGAFGARPQDEGGLFFSVEEIDG